jgi:hypothetical protein
VCYGLTPEGKPEGKVPNELPQFSAIEFAWGNQGTFSFCDGSFIVSEAMSSVYQR